MPASDRVDSGAVAGARLGLLAIVLVGVAGLVDRGAGPPLTMAALYGLAAAHLAHLFVPAPVPLRPWACAKVADVVVRRGILARAALLHGLALVLLPLGWIGIGSIAWLLALLMVPFAFVERLHPPPLRLGAAQKWELAAVALILVVGALYRFYALGEYPPGIHGDETEFGMISLAVLRGEGPYPFGVAFLGDPALFVYVNAVGIALLGQTIEAIRAVAALSGWLSLPPLYWLARRMFGARVALPALAFLATNHTHVHFSRLALNVSEVLLLTTLAFACLWEGLSRGRPIWYVLAGLAGGMDLYFHFGARPLPLVFGAIFLLFLGARPAYWRVAWRPTGLTMLGALFALGPAMLYFARHPGALNEHSVDRLIFSHWDHVTRVHGTTDPVLVLVGQLAKNLAIFVPPSPASTFYSAGGDATFVAPVVPLILLGMAVALRRSRDARFAYLVLWFLGFLAAGVLSIDAPQPHRLVAMLPVAALFAGMIAGQVVSLGGLAFGQRGRAALAVGLAGLVVVAGVEDARAFFARSAGVQAWADSTLQARYIGAQPPGTTVLVAGAPHLYAGHGTTRFLAGHLHPRDIQNLPTGLAELEGGSGPVTVLVHTQLLAWLPIVEAYYPGGVREELVDGRGQVHHVGYRLGASPEGRRAAVDLSRGLQLTLTPTREPGRAPPLQVDPVVAYRNAATVGGRQPYTATWTGEIMPRQSGEHRVEVSASGEVRLAIGGRTVLERNGPGDGPLSAQVRLNGRQPIELRYVYRDGPGVVELYWQPPGGQRELIPPGALLPPPGR